MDLLSYQETYVHKLDPRAKLLVLILYIFVVLSAGRYDISKLVPFTVFPLYLLISGNIPLSYILKKIVIVSPFALMIGIFNPLFDPNIIAAPWGGGVSAGWFSFISIVLRFALTVSAALAVITCTGFYNICFAMERLGVPKVFAVQLLFLYRYIFVLAEEAARMVRARNLRSSGRKGRGIGSYGPLLGNLLLRTVGRAERIHLAMVCRGFDGNLRIMKGYSFGWREYLFILIWGSIFILLRLFNISLLAGNFLTGKFI